jgi:hypothetical protein
MSRWYDVPSDEEWISFFEATEELRRLLSISRGAAERTLRELCSDGTVRALLLRYGADGEVVEAPELVKPSEWVRDQVDLTTMPEEGIEVSKDDLNHWLPKWRPETVGKRPRIMKQLSELHPRGVPDPGLAPRKTLKADLLRRDPTLTPLDEATLKAAIEEYNKACRASLWSSQS